MKRLLFIFLIFSISCTSYNQETTSLEGEQILVGKVNWDGFTNPPYNEWFAPTYLDYVVDTTNLALVKSSIHKFEILMYMGTLCTDSQVEVPQFYKILDYLEYDLDQLSNIALEKSEDGKLVSPQHEEAGYAITHVPTFIFLKNGMEVGRIIEYPSKTLEKDMVEIMTE